MSDDTQLCDLNTYIEANQSPGLKPVQPNFESSETPPPFVNETSSESSEDEGEGRRRFGKPKRRRHRGQTKPSQCDRVLLSYLDPKRPDIAIQAGRHALESASQSEAEFEEEEDIDLRPNGDQMTVSYGDHEAARSADTKTEALAVAALRAAQRLNEVTTPIENGALERVTSSRIFLSGTYQRIDKPITNGIHMSNGYLDTRSLQPALDLVPTQKPLDVRPPPRLPPISTDGADAKRDETGNDEESIATSPALAKFAINREDADPTRILPAMQKSPSRSLSSGSLDYRQTLPSLTTITTALNMNDSAIAPFSSHSSTLTRPSPSHFGPSPSTYSQSSSLNSMSPRAFSSAPSLWRTGTRDGSATTPSDQPSVPTSAATSATISTPASSIPTQSPAASYPTPTASSSEQTRHDSQDDTVISPGSDGQVPNGVDASNGPFLGHTFKCNKPDCNAAPFQTQYLLNSHMNVHSNTRPHFCPVKGCARGPGGQGFKRKNEMIRHGLVHTSPGYMCPFCPDQQHKYPRPDNLQRHVRVHHVDKERDDPQLREVLAQRPEGGNRGRRRRLNS